MKKIISLLLAFSLLTGVSMTAIAEDSGAGKAENTNSQSINVKGSYMPKNASETFFVDVEWSGLQFTYHEKTDGKWNPNKLDYDDGSKAYWESSADSSHNYGTITVTNKSEPNPSVSLIVVSFNFEKDSSFDNKKTVQMKFSEDDKMTDPDVNSSELYLENSVNSTDTMYVFPAIGQNVGEADFTAADGNLGTITITIAPEATGDPGNPDGPQIFD